MELRNGKLTSNKPQSNPSRKRLIQKNNSCHSVTKRARLRTFDDIGDLVASIPSQRIRQQIFGYFHNTTKVSLLPLFQDPKHKPFLLSFPPTWTRITLPTDKTFFKKLKIIKTHLSAHCQQIRLNANVYHSEYLDFPEDYHSAEHSDLVEFLYERAVSFDNYDCMFMDKLDDIHDETMQSLQTITDDEFNRAHEFCEKDLRWLAQRSFNAKLLEIERNCSPGYPREIISYYKHEIKQDRLPAIRMKFRDYSIHSKLILNRQMHIWKNVEQVEDYALSNRLFADLRLFKFKNLRALHIWGGFLRDSHGAALAELENLCKLSIFSEYTMCPDFQRDRYDCYTHSLLEITDEFFSGFIAKNRQALKYLEFADWCPVEDYEIREVWDHSDLARFAPILDQVNVRRTFFSAETFQAFLTHAMSPQADACHLYLNPFILNQSVLDALLAHCVQLKELSVKHCVDHDDYGEMPNEVITRNLAAFGQLESLLLKNMYFDTRTIFSEANVRRGFPSLSFLKYTCSFNDQRYLESIIHEIRTHHQSLNTLPHQHIHRPKTAHAKKVSRAREYFEFRPHRPSWQNFYAFTAAADSTRDDLETTTTSIQTME